MAEVSVLPPRFAEDYIEIPFGVAAHAAPPLVVPGSIIEHKGKCYGRRKNSMKTSINLAAIKQIGDERLLGLPTGWLMGTEAKILYTAAQHFDEGDAILEIGSWSGRSTCCIAYGLQDAGKRPRFDVIDFGIAGPGEWEERFGHDILGRADAGRFLDDIQVPGGTAALLKQNLADRKLGKHVTMIMLGDLRDLNVRTRYDMIFCDATHDDAEIDRTIPMMAGSLDEEFVLICDDIQTDQTAARITTMVGADRYALSNEIDEYTKFAVITKGERYRQFLA